MRLNQLCILTLAGTVAVTLLGCASGGSKEATFREVPPPSTSPTNRAPTVEPGETGSTAPVSSPAPDTAPELIVTPDNTLEGTVVSVNDAGRFAVLKFPIGRMPALESTLYVHRQGLKVGELKVTGPQKDDHVVADIREGDCRVADVVRDR